MGTPRKWALSAARITSLSLVGAWANRKVRAEIRALAIPQWQQVGVAASVAAFAAYYASRSSAAAGRPC